MFIATGLDSQGCGFHCQMSTTPMLHFSTTDLQYRQRKCQIYLKSYLKTYACLPITSDENCL